MVKGLVWELKQFGSSHLDSVTDWICVFHEQLQFFVLHFPY